jgi:hypothetical protein
MGRKLSVKQPTTIKLGNLMRVLVVLTTLSLHEVKAQDTAAPLLKELHRVPLDVSVVSRLEQVHDARVLPALRQAFEEHEVKQARQHIAISLIRLGVRDEEYYQLLAGYARAAVESDAPDVLVHDQNGDAIKGALSPEFRIWAVRSGLNVKEATGLSVYTYPEDVLLLSTAKDPRAADLFKKGLQSRNGGVVAFSAQGLALLNDASAVSLIYQASQANGRVLGRMLISSLAMYTDPVALRLIDQLVLNDEARKFYKKAHEAFSGSIGAYPAEMTDDGS